MNTTAIRLITATLLFAGVFSLQAHAQDDLAAGFRAPPNSAKPHTWWHWMNGNITKEGITADLEAMKRIGLGGAQIFNVSEDIPQGLIAYNSPEWRAMVKHAATEADRLGLELCIHNCAGWSSSGGPWVEPQYAMQTIVVSETHAQGPVAFAQDLPQPRTNHNYYRDIAVLAFPTPKDDTTRIGDIKAKALYEYKYGLQPSLAPTPADASIPRTSIVDVTANLKDGALHWDVPAGDWTILRIGHTPTGAVNAPSPTPGRGLEVDKLSRDAFDHFWAGGMAPLIKELGPLAGKSLRNVLIDSYEVGCQNWTPQFRAEFLKRRGYDPILYLPAMTGRIIDSGETTERFLWDLRRTVADLFTDNYYSYFAETCRKNGLLSSVEPYDGPFECSQVARDADIVMGEFWVTADMRSSCKLAASVAHVFGKTIVGAESFTAAPNQAGWRTHPGNIKAVGDLMFSEGINRCIIHRFAHQPWLNIEPGMTMGQWGTHFERTSTWWDHGGPEWVEYLSRCQYLLQEGRFAADVLFLAGECAPNGAPHEPGLKSHGFDYDSCGLDALAQAQVHAGNIVLPSGMTYRLLVLPESTFMTRALMDRVESLVLAGASVLGPAPLNTPTLQNASADDEAVRTCAKALWETPEHPTEGSRSKGVAKAGIPVEQMLASMGAQPDATFMTTSGAKAGAAWIHRIVGETDIYFVSNQKPRSEEIECSFRIDGKAPELWHPETGLIEPAPRWRVESGRTIVTTRFDPAGSVFIVFRPGAGGNHVVAVRAPATSQAHVPKIEITKARYEATDGAGGTDVTAKVAAMVASGETEIPASNGAFGDPTYNHVKRLHVEYAIDGKAIARDIPENGTLVLVEPGPDGPPSFEIVGSAGGGVELRAFKAADYELSTSDGAAHKVSVSSVPAPIALTGPWSIAFQPGRGAPASATLDALASWTRSADAGVKYFSGTATYEKDFDIPANLIGDARTLVLNLGEVHEFAEVSLNGKKLRTLWKPPFSLDITGVATAGKNHLVVKITNLWANRLIGDEQFPEDTKWARQAPSPLKAWPDWFAPVASSANATLSARPTKERLTFTTWKHWNKDSPLLDSGLIGPVVIQASERRKVTIGN
jgi:hypothetical protein